MGLRTKLLERLKRRLGRGEPDPGPRAEWAFGPRRADDWQEMREQYALAFQTVSSAVVASWEVVAAELNAAARRQHADQAGDWVVRFSDSLVPTLAPIQAYERATGPLWKQSTAAGQANGRVADAVAPLAEQVRALGAEVAEAWPKTTAHCAPLLEAIGADDAARARFEAVGGAMRTAFDARAEELVAALGGLPTATDFDKAFLDAIETYRHGLAQDVEVALDNVRAVLVESLKRTA